MPELAHRLFCIPQQAQQFIFRVAGKQAVLSINKNYFLVPDSQRLNHTDIRQIRSVYPDELTAQFRLNFSYASCITHIFLQPMQNNAVALSTGFKEKDLVHRYVPDRIHKFYRKILPVLSAFFTEPLINDFKRLSDSLVHFVLIIFYNIVQRLQFITERIKCQFTICGNIDQESSGVYPPYRLSQSKS